MEILQARIWSGFLWPPPGDLPNPGIKPTSLTSPALAGEFFSTLATCEDLGNTEMGPKRLLKVLSKDDGLLSCDNFQGDFISLIGDTFFINRSKISWLFLLIFFSFDWLKVINDNNSEKTAVEGNNGRTVYDSDLLILINLSWSTWKRYPLWNPLSKCTWLWH